MESRSAARSTKRSAGACLACVCLLGAGSWFPGIASGSSSVDICREPAPQNQLAIAYYNEDKTSFDGGSGNTDRTDYRTDLSLSLNENWVLGFGHRSTILNVEDLVLQTNGYLHAFFLPVHRISHSDGRRFRISISPVLSGSSNIVKDPDEYTADAFQLLGALVWSRQLSDRAGFSYGICGDYRLGGFRIYPVVGVNWQAHPDWRVELGFPTSQLRYNLSVAVDLLLRLSPNGNEWYVKDKNLEKNSTVIYEAWMLEWAVNWHVHQHFLLSASVSRDFDGQYEMTLLDESRVRLFSDAATRIGATFVWRF